MNTNQIEQVAALAKECAAFLRKITGQEFKINKREGFTGAETILEFKAGQEVLSCLVRSHELEDLPAGILVSKTKHALYRLLRRDKPELLKPEYQDPAKIREHNLENTLAFAEWCLKNAYKMPGLSPDDKRIWNYKDARYVDMPTLHLLFIEEYYKSFKNPFTDEN